MDENCRNCGTNFAEYEGDFDEILTSEKKIKKEEETKKLTGGVPIRQRPGTAMP